MRIFKVDEKVWKMANDVFYKIGKGEKEKT